jgi:hypothetical protein
VEQARGNRGKAGVLTELVTGLLLVQVADLLGRELGMMFNFNVAPAGD